MALFTSLSDCSVDGVATFACLGILMRNVVVMLMVASALATLLMLVLGGIRFTLSGGDPKKVGQAKGTLTYAIIGIVVVFLAFVIMQLLSKITGNTDILNGPSLPKPQ